MKTDLLSDIASTFATLSLVAIGGANAILPEIHQQVVTTHNWMNDITFANLFAIAQAAPGPNVILVSLIGWHLAGPLGLIVATLAICLPSSVVALVVSRIRRRLLHAPWLRVLQMALLPIPIGLMGASGVIMARAADTTILTAFLTAGTALYVGVTQRNPVWALAAGGLTGGLSYAFS